MPTTNEPEKKINVEVGMFIMDRHTGQMYEVVDLVPSIRPGNRSYVAKCEPVLYMGGPKSSDCHFNPIELNVDDAINDGSHRYMVFGNAVDPKRKLDLEQHIVRSDPYFERKWYIENELYRLHIHFKRHAVVGVLKIYDRDRLTFTLLDNDATITVTINDVIDGKVRLERYFTEKQVSALTAFNVKYAKEDEDWLGRHTAKKTPETENAPTADIKEDTNSVTPNNTPTDCDNTMILDAQLIIHPGQCPIVNVKTRGHEFSKESYDVLKRLSDAYGMSLVTAVQHSNEPDPKPVDTDKSDIPEPIPLVQQVWNNRPK